MKHTVSSNALYEGRVQGYFVDNLHSCECECSLCSFCILRLCVESILASDRGALWVGRSLTPTVKSEQRRVNVPGPARCTDTLLVSVVSRAEQGRATQAQGENETKGEILHSQWEQDGWCVQAVGLHTWFGWRQGSGSVCVGYVTSLCQAMRTELKIKSHSDIFKELRTMLQPFNYIVFIFYIYLYFLILIFTYIFIHKEYHFFLIFGLSTI